MLGNIPQSIGRYLIQEEIGRGGFGKVFKASSNSGEEAAIKVMFPSPFLSESQIKQIIKNTREISETCSSLNIVKSKEDGFCQSFYYMVFDYYKNGSLEKILLEKKLNILEKIDYLISIAQTLHQLHTKGIIHGDIKPANVLLSDNNVPLISDFYYDFKIKHIPGMPRGTIDYMSPEQAEGKLFSYSSDIYSIGVMAYLLLTGRSPFSECNSIKDLLEAKMKGVFPEPASVAKIPKSLNEAILKAMATDPQDRFQSASQFAETLQAIKKAMY